MVPVHKSVFEVNKLNGKDTRRYYIYGTKSALKNVNNVACEDISGERCPNFLLGFVI